MRMLRLVGCALLISTATANAQPAPDSDAPPNTDPVAPEPSPSVAPPATSPPLGTPPAALAPIAPRLRPPSLTAPGTMPAVPLATPAPETETETETEDYRWQIAAVDAASVALVLSQNEAGGSIGGLAYVLGGPIIHGAHNQGARMGASLALRVGLPILLAFGGAKLAQHNAHCSPDDDDCGEAALGGALLGFGVGILAAMVVDTALIARPVEVHKHTGATWAPQTAVTPQHVGLGVVGRF